MNKLFTLACFEQARKTTAKRKLEAGTGDELKAKRRKARQAAKEKKQQIKELKAMQAEGTHQIEGLKEEATFYDQVLLANFKKAAKAKKQQIKDLEDKNKLSETEEAIFRSDVDARTKAAFLGLASDQRPVHKPNVL